MTPTMTLGTSRMRSLTRHTLPNLYRLTGGTELDLHLLQSFKLCIACLDGVFCRLLAASPFRCSLLA